MMLHKIKILLMILAVVLNLLHDVRIHDHHSASDPSCINQQTLEHFHDSKSICTHSDNESDKLPFQHCHIEHSHPFTRFVNPLSSISAADNFIINEIYNHFNIIESSGVVQTNNFIICLYKNIIGLSAGLRAPPALS